MSKTYRPYQPTQSFLLPPSPLDWLPEDHLARFVLDTVGELDLSEIHTHYEREARGKPPHHPQMMVALLLYAYCVGVPSSRKMEKRTYEDVAFRVLAGNTQPDHTPTSPPNDKSTVLQESRRSPQLRRRSPTSKHRCGASCPPRREPRCTPAAR